MSALCQAMGVRRDTDTLSGEVPGVTKHGFCWREKTSFSSVLHDPCESLKIEIWAIRGWEGGLPMERTVVVTYLKCSLVPPFG